MKKYFIGSDVHDDVEALKAFVDYAQAQEADRILIAGDLSQRPYTKKDLTNLIQTEDTNSFIQAKRAHARNLLNDMKEALDSSEIPYLVIPGNYDGNNDIETVFTDKNLHLKTIEDGEIKIAGVGNASQTPQHIGLLIQLGEIDRFDQRELEEYLLTTEADIIMSHAPPYKLCDHNFQGQNWGSETLTAYLIAFEPKLIVSGHVHEAGPSGKNPKGCKGLEKSNKTYVINPGNLGRFELVNPQTLDTHMQFDFGTFAEVELNDDGTPIKLVQYTLSAPGRNVGQVRKITEYNL